MPIKIPNNLPAERVLEEERIQLIKEDRAIRQDIRPIRIALLNLMPNKIATEIQVARALGCSPLQVELTLLRTQTYTSKTTPLEHLKSFYKTFDDVKDEYFDGIIINGTPVASIPYEQVDYWDEMKMIFDWSNTHAFSQFFLCWGA
ncbi:MAG: homoserine O-acetyltransferase/O-succinyltransferase family protein, partial [Bdellovibrionales bacterium]